MRGIHKREEDNEASLYPESIVKLAQNPPYYFRMDDFTNSACMSGACGDSMEFYLYVEDDIIKKVSFYTDGCISTRACGSVAAQFVLGKSIEDALNISPKMILDKLSGLPGHFNHCAVLAVTTFLRAVADHLLCR